MTAMPPPPSYTGPPVQQQGTGSYATWGSRFLAYLIDGAIVTGILLLGVIPLVIGIGAASAVEGSGDGAGAIGAVMLLLAAMIYAVALGFALWNQGWRQGTTGQSIGKSVMKISVIRENGQFMGPGLGFGRLIIHAIVGGACFLDYLWPLWDDKVQTWTDKIVSTIVVRA